MTLIFHLVVIIVLLVFSIGRAVTAENSFLLDFSREEAEQKKQEREEMQRSISEIIDEKIASAPTPSIRNVAVSTILQDDRNSSAEARKLQREAERLASELKQGFKSDVEEDAREESVDISHHDSGKAEVPYSGPSVLRFTLEGRKASLLPIPAYRCYGAGVVSVAISVDQRGNVVAAKVMDEVSDSDECLRKFAVRAARLSRFSASTSAPARQGGEIVYSFIAQ